MNPQFVIHAIINLSVFCSCEFEYSQCLAVSLFFQFSLYQQHYLLFFISSKFHNVDQTNATNI